MSDCQRRPLTVSAAYFPAGEVLLVATEVDRISRNTGGYLGGLIVQKTGYHGEIQAILGDDDMLPELIGPFVDKLVGRRHDDVGLRAASVAVGDSVLGSLFEAEGFSRSHAAASNRLVITSGVIGERYAH